MPPWLEWQAAVEPEIISGLHLRSHTRAHQLVFVFNPLFISSVFLFLWFFVFSRLEHRSSPTCICIQPTNNIFCISVFVIDTDQAKQTPSVFVICIFSHPKNFPFIWNLWGKDLPPCLNSYLSLIGPVISPELPNKSSEDPSNIAVDLINNPVRKCLQRWEEKIFEVQFLWYLQK